jgi:hypothetical protein
MKPGDVFKRSQGLEGTIEISVEHPEYGGWNGRRREQGGVVVVDRKEGVPHRIEQVDDSASRC